MHKEKIETELRHLIYVPKRYPSGQYTGDPFIAYQEGWLSKRKLISIIADCLKEE